MRSRCFNRNHSSYDRYGGRGITIDSIWDDYFNFYTWALDSGYVCGLTLDRIDNDGNYNPENCRWATHKEQGNNTSKNKNITAWGETKTISLWADDIRCTVPLNTLYQRIENEWQPEKAIALPSVRKSTSRPLLFDQYQALAECTAQYPGQGTMEGLQYAVLGLASEVGEVAGKLKKVIRDDSGNLSEETRHNLIKELSDVLWYCAAICSELGISLGSVAEMNITKLQDRVERGVIQGSGDNR